MMSSPSNPNASGVEPSHERSLLPGPAHPGPFAVGPQAGQTKGDRRALRAARVQGHDGGAAGEGGPGLAGSPRLPGLLGRAGVSPGGGPKGMGDGARPSGKGRPVRIAETETAKADAGAGTDGLWPPRPAESIWRAAMSLWSDVSKEVGWEPREVAIPKPEAAMAAVDWARAGMCPALGELLTINRF